MNYRICPHCKTYMDSNIIRCSTCGRVLSDVIYSEEELEKEYKNFEKYINKTLNPKGVFSDFKALLKDQFNIKGNDEKDNIAFTLTMEHLIYQKDFNPYTLRRRYLELATDLNNLKKMPVEKYQEMVHEDAKGMFFHILNTREIQFNLYNHIPEHTVPVSVVKNKHGTGTKVVATGLFGVFGLAGTSGVKEETYNKVVPARDELTYKVNINANENNISIQIIDINQDKKLPKNTYSWNQITEADADDYLKSKEFDAILLKDFNAEEITQSIENIYYIFLNEDHTLRKAINIPTLKRLLLEDFKEYVNNHAYGNYVHEMNDEAKQLEEFYTLKEKGIITEREYLNKKNEILKTSRNEENNGAHEQINFCPNCGNKLDKDDKFCSACGTKII